MNNGDQEQVAAAYRKAMQGASPSPGLDARMVALAKASLEDTAHLPNPRTRTSWLLAAAAMLVITVASILWVSQGPDSNWQPVGSEVAKPPATLPPVPAIEAPELTPPNVPHQPVAEPACGPDPQPPCPADKLPSPGQ